MKRWMVTMLSAAAVLCWASSVPAQTLQAKINQVRWGMDLDGVQTACVQVELPPDPGHHFTKYWCTVTNDLGVEAAPLIKWIAHVSVDVYTKNPEGEWIFLFAKYVDNKKGQGTVEWTEQWFYEKQSPKSGYHSCPFSSPPTARHFTPRINSQVKLVSTLTVSLDTEELGPSELRLKPDMLKKVDEEIYSQCWVDMDSFEVFYPE